MSPFVAVARTTARLCSLSLSALLALALLPSHDLQAQSRKTRELDAVKMRMAAAEGRYRDALVKVGNNDPAGLIESNAALEDMEDAIAACLKLKGCPISDLLTSYKRLLKADVDGRAAGDAAIGEDEQGLIDTEILDEQVPVEEILKMVPAARMGTPEEVAGAVNFLMSEEAAYITRQVLAVNGGLC